MIKKVKNTIPCTYVISDLNVKDIIGMKIKFENQCWESNQTESYISNAMETRIMFWLIRKMLLYKVSQFFPKPYERFSRNIKT